MSFPVIVHQIDIFPPISGDFFCKTALLQLFNEIQSLDGLDDGMISPNELKHLLRRLNIHFSNKSFEDAFAIIDTNCDGFVSLMEFHAFIFPKEAAVVSIHLLGNKYFASSLNVTFLIIF